VSVWIGAHQVVQGALSAVTGAWTGMRRRESTKPDSMEQVALIVEGAADALDGMPECEDFVAQLREIADRYETGARPTQKGFRDDRDRLTLIEQELLRRMREGPG